MRPVWSSFFSHNVWQKSSGSLTARLKACGSFRVKVLAQGFAMPTRDEMAALGVSRRALVYARTVCLSVDNAPCVVARSVVPRTAMRLAWHRVRQQGSRPLGERLWSNPLVRRGPLQFAILNKKHAIYQALDAYWSDLPVQAPARRAVFHLKKQPLVVMEVFLPHIQELPCPSHR